MNSLTSAQIVKVMRALRAGRLVGAALRRSKWLQAQVSRPSVGQLSDVAAGRIACNASAWLEHLVPKPQLEDYAAEFAEVTEVMRERYRSSVLHYPLPYAIEDETALGLYSLVRFLRPGTIVETGVANGHSTFVLLSALRANGHGMLHSIDVANDVGALLRDEDKTAWRYHQLRQGDRQQFTAALRRFPPPDVFIHDSDHSHGWQAFEFASALDLLRPGAFLVADDVDDSFAFLEMCQERRFTARLLLDTRKIVGFCTIPSASD